MSKADTMSSGAASQAPSPGYRGPFAVVRQAIVAMLANRAMRAAASRLHALDDRMLKDIGLSRGEIDSVLSDLADRRRPGARIWPAASR